MEFMKMHDTQSPVEQVIAVPKISSNRMPQRFVDRPRPQWAEQLVEVPAEPAYVKQIVDISVPGGFRHSREGLQGSSASSSENRSSVADEAFERVFRTFPRKKKCGVRPAVRRSPDRWSRRALELSRHGGRQ